MGRHAFPILTLLCGLAGAARAQGPAPGPAQPPPADPRLPSALDANPIKGVRFVAEGVTPNQFFDSPETKVATLEVKLGQGRIVVLKESLTAPGGAQPVLALGDPSIADFVLLAPRQLRVVGRRLGTTDLSVTSSDGKTHSIDIHVVADLDPLRQQLRRVFPSSNVKLSQVLDQVFIEGEARDSRQAVQIVRSVTGFLQSQQGMNAASARNTTVGPAPPDTPPPPPAPGQAGAPNPTIVRETSMGGDAPSAGAADATTAYPSIVNLLRVPGSQQVLLKVRIAELNRDAFRQVGGNFFGIDRRSGSILGTQVGGANVFAQGSNVVNGQPGNKLVGSAAEALSGQTTFFGILQQGNLEFLLNALRRNSMLKVLAEPNLMALNGQQASFLAGGEFPVPVPQVSASGVAPTITVQFKKFGVQLDFLPAIMDGDVVRLTVDPVVSTIDFTIGATLVAGGTPVPGLNTRQAHTTVELRPGQTLAIAGLLSIVLDGQTNRIPGLGDLPILGPFFSNTTNQRVEKELVVLVTPYLVEPMSPNQVPLGPGDEVGTPTDWEFYFLNRIESRAGLDWRSTTRYPDPLFIPRYIQMEKKSLQGPSGFSE
jgi:pilus assembly protein CpaC